MPIIEVCTLEPVYSSSLLGGQKPIKVVAKVGSMVIAEEPLTSQDGEMWPNALSRLVVRMGRDGWEPTDGGMTSLKRTKPTTLTEANNPTSLLQQLANLRDAGILTQQEFETKKAEILKRI